MANSNLPHVCLPVNLDAFILNEQVCNPPTSTTTGNSLIAPITQPNYLGLRLENNHVQHDVLPNVDLHNAANGASNPRIADALNAPFLWANSNPEPDATAAFPVNRQRLGVYLHWSIPRGFRAAKSAAPPPDGSSASNPKLTQQPVFPLVPNRWLIVRILHPGWTASNLNPQTAKALNDQPVKAWVVESDRLRKVEELTTDILSERGPLVDSDNALPIDLETDVAPFVAYSGSGAKDDPDILNQQAENYLGARVPLDKWQECKGSRDQQSSNATGSNFVDLSVLNSSNPLFADYSPHNGNVFSIKDNLYCGNGQYLDTATCDYIVLGWFSDHNDDPLWNDTSVGLDTRLKNLFCKAPPQNSQPDSVDDPRSTNTGQTRLVCHATKYNVVFSHAKPQVTAADDYAKNFTKDVDMEPVAVGTSPLDAALAFIHAHSGKNDTALADVLKDKPTATTLHDIRELLYATEDDYDSRIKAADLVYAHNFTPEAGGFRWRFDKKAKGAGPPVAPSADVPNKTKIPVDPRTGEPNPLALLSEVELMSQLNNAQRTLDAGSSELDLFRWNLFAEWFKYVSDPLNSSTGGDSKSEPRMDMYTGRVKLLQGDVERLNAICSAAAQKIKDIKKFFADKQVEVKMIGQDSFYRRADPTLCLAGIDAGWDPAFLSKTPTRFAENLNRDAVAHEPSDMDKIKSWVGDKTRYTSNQKALPFGSDLSDTLVGLLTEACKGAISLAGKTGFQTWEGQPFAPQYLEWEGLYYHVPWSDDNWDIKLTTSAIATSNHKQFMYTSPKRLAGNADVLHDVRAVAGRMLIMPQPSFALGAVVAQVLDASNADNIHNALHDPAKENDLADPIKKQDLINKAKAMRFISGELSGLTEGLLTMTKGQHVKPNLRRQGEDTVSMQPARVMGQHIKMVDADFDTIAGESGNLPYSTLVRFPDDPKAPNPFKGVQHGQFAITKLTLVDKFGQVVACPYPKRKPRPGSAAAKSNVPDFVHPCLSEQLVPSVLDDGTLNTIYTTDDTHDHWTSTNVPMTPFIQLNPAINQNARLNASFLEPRADNTGWTPCSEWENPIFGWLIVNYADSALQFFTADGTFYTSRLFGGPKGTIVSRLWLPFERPSKTSAQGKASPQLVALIESLAQADRLEALWDIIQSAIPSMPFPPSDYAPYANAIIGKPLALVNVGLSLELEQPPLWGQHTLPLPPPVANGVDPSREKAKTDMSKYAFKIKIGDVERPFDGVVAYWDNPNSTSSTQTNFDIMYSYGTPANAPSFCKPIEPGNFERLTPYFIEPPKSLLPTADTPRSFVQQHTDMMKIKTMLVDPYAAVHVFSGILPIKSLSLPPWTISQGLKNMTAFFSAGPILITKDVPASYDSMHPLMPDTWLGQQTQDTSLAAVDPGEAVIRLPIAGTKGLWNWLQPYVAAADGQTHYNALPVELEDGKMRGDPGPYTFVEGYLSLARALGDEVPKGGG